ncbi:MAG: stomatin-like protein [Pseudomonadota bacterium]|nr:stomatin-like protein [Pseudomonadota bacterium]
MDFLLLLFIILVVTVFAKTVIIVPQREAFIVERLGRYSTTLSAGFHILLPFIDKLAYKHTLKEQAMEVSSQVCITRDNIAVEVDGILYLQVIDPKSASYGINNYQYATAQIAQTTMRSIIGKMDLDKTFEERELINKGIVSAVDGASEPWGVKVTRYEVKNIVPPKSIKDAMEKQMRAEREKRALIAESEGDKQAKINRAEGEKQELIRLAEGKAFEISTVANATAAGISAVAKSIGDKDGLEAVNLKVAENYIKEFGNIAKESNTLIIPSNLADISGVAASLMSVVKKTNHDNKSSN